MAESSRRLPTATPGLSVEEAQNRIYRQLPAPLAAGNLPLIQATRRILANDIFAPMDVPPHRGSAMDGYAVAAGRSPGNGPATFTVIGTVHAGQVFNRTVGKAECVRIMTGAPLPPGTDSVILQEDVEIAGDEIRCSAAVTAGQNVRHPGEDIRRGDRVLAAGRRLTPADLGVLASLGFDSVPVYPALKVAYFTSGDELRSPGDHAGQPLAEGQIYNSNRYSLAGLLQRPGIDPAWLGTLPDDPAVLGEKLDQAGRTADVIITTGGVSVGDKDYVTRVLQARGTLDLWKIAMKPGKPLAFGRLHSAWFFGLPGNPVSAMVTFCIIVLPALRLLMGEKAVLPRKLPARNMRPLEKKPGRTDFQRGILSLDANGQLTVESTGPQGSHRLLAMSRADCLIVIPADRADVPAGELVSVIPFSEFA